MMNLLQNSQYFSRKRIWVRWRSFAVEHTTMTTSPWPTRRNIKSNKFTITPWLLDLLCKHWFTSSVCNFCHWGADVPPGEISLAARSNGCIRRLLKSQHFQIDQKSGGLRTIKWTRYLQIFSLLIYPSKWKHKVIKGTVDEVKQKLANKSRIFYSHVLMNTSGKVVMAAIVTVSNKQKLALSKIKLWRKDLIEEKKTKISNKF